MQIEDWPSAKSLSLLYRELKQLDLLEYVAELEASASPCCHPMWSVPPNSTRPLIIWGDHTWHGSYPRQTDG